MKKRKERVLALLLCAALLCGCGGNVQPGYAASTETTSEVKNETTQKTEQEILDPEIAYWMENLPRMDGSTSLIGLEAGVRAALFGISLEEATLQVSHSSTWGSFYNLIEGKADLIFSCPLSAEQEGEGDDPRDQSEGQAGEIEKSGHGDLLIGQNR